MGVTTILYLLSSLSGVEKGIKFFANLNFRFYMVLTAIVLVLGGSAAFIFNTSTSAIGYWLQNLHCGVLTQEHLVVVLCCNGGQSTTGHFGWHLPQ